jgi:hypothetical protein
MYRVKLFIVVTVMAGFAAFSLMPPSFDAAAQGKKGQKKGAKPAPKPAAVKEPPQPSPPPPPPAPATNPGSGAGTMVKPPTASDTPGSGGTMVKPPTAGQDAAPVKPPTAPTPTATPTPAPKPPPTGLANNTRKSPKPPAGNIIGVIGVKGKAVPYAGKEEPAEPLLYSTDNEKKFVAKAAFDHNKHSREASYSVNGTTVSTCAECHHTDQAATTPGVPAYYTLFERKELMTSKTLAESNQLVSSCRVCHISNREDEVEDYPPPGVEYSESESDKSEGYKGKTLDSENAYHINCIVCHERAKTARPAYNFKFLPLGTKCNDCHTKT